MEIEEFKEYVKRGEALSSEEIHRFMNRMSDEARRITFRLNTAYHTPDEVRGLLSELFGYRSRCVFSRPSIPISGATSRSAAMSSSMPAAISRTTAG